MTKRVSSFILAIVLSVAVFGSAGCGKHAYVVHPNSINTFDSETFDALYDAQTTIETAKSQLASQNLPASSAPIIDGARVLYNQCEVDYQTWHHVAQLGSGDASALAKLQTDMADLKSSIGGLKNLLGK